MLTKSEKEIMNAVYSLCNGNEKCLVSVFDILSVLPPKSDFTVDKVESIMKTLELDDYFEVIMSERKGEKVYVITLHNNGVAFKREIIQERRSVYFKVALSVGGAILTFIVGMILKAIF